MFPVTINQAISTGSALLNTDLKEVYGGNNGDNIVEQEYVIPDNLKKFYAAMERKNQNTESQCCGSSGSSCC